MHIPGSMCLVTQELNGVEKQKFVSVFLRAGLTSVPVFSLECQAVWRRSHS